MSDREFWEKVHLMDNDLYTYWLSNSAFEQIWTGLNIMSKLKPHIKILNIGPGTGREVKELCQNQNSVIVDVMDISQASIDNVKGITRNQYLASNIEDLPSNEYDIVLSYLVAEVMENDDLENQIKYVVRSLRPNGIFALQFADMDNNRRLSKEDIERLYPEKISYPRFRSLTEIIDMVNRCNGEIVWASNPQTDIESPIIWYYVHINKKL